MRSTKYSSTFKYTHVSFFVYLFFVWFRIITGRDIPNAQRSPSLLAEIIEIIDDGLRRLQESLTNSNRIDPIRDARVHTNGSIQHGNEYSRPADEPAQNNRNEPPVIFNVDDKEVEEYIPGIPPSFPEFKEMSLMEVIRIAENKAFLDLYVDETPGVANMRELKSSIEASNVESARTNLARQENIEALSAEIETLKQDLSDRVQQYQSLDAERLALTESPRVSDVITDLQRASRDAQRESDNLAERWIEGGGGGDDVGDFVQRFLEVRKRYHMREAKADILGRWGN